MGSILWKLVATAAADSVNPCTFYIFSALLLAVSLRLRSPRYTLMIAFSFIAGVYVGYYLLGLGIAYAGTMLPRAVLLAVALAYGGVVIANGLSELIRGKPLTPKPGRILSGKALKATDIAASGLLGFTLSLTLLPCSGGPLLAFIYAASVEGYSTAKIALLLLLYNIIFVAPLVAIAIAFAASGRLVASKIPPKLQSALEVAAGVLVIVIVALTV